MIRVAKEYWARAEQVARAVVGSGAFDSLDEQAGPAYLEGNPLSRWLFWRRLSLVVGHLPLTRGDLCVDFGCGFGLLLPLLGKHFQAVLGIDPLCTLARAFLDGWGREFGNAGCNIRVAPALEDSGVQEGSADLVLALDVLEHVPDLPAVLSMLHGILAPGGVLVVCGPTENWLYKWGRRVVGFSGDYHRHNIYTVLKAMQPGFAVRIVRRLPRLAPLFVMAIGRKAACDGCQ